MRPVICGSVLPTTCPSGGCDGYIQPYYGLWGMGGNTIAMDSLEQ